MAFFISNAKCYNQEIFTDDASIEAMSKNTVDIYTMIKEQGKGSKVIVWIDLGGGIRIICNTS